jgi:MFS family permease
MAVQTHHAPAPVTRERSPNAVLALCSAAAVLVVGFVASVNLAVPDLASGSLHPSAASLLWIVDAYVVVFACLVIPGGAAGDRYGRKGVMTAGLAVFAFGAVVSTVAPEVAVMLVGRGITGLGAAAVLPNSLAILVHATPPARRPGSIAIWASMTGIGGAVGNIGGGVVLSSGSWRALFGAAAALAAALCAWVAIAAPRTARGERRIDPLAASLLTLAAASLLFGIIEGPQHGWGSDVVLGAFAGAVVLAVAWALVELRSEEPLLDPRLFRIPPLRAACLGMFVSFFGLFGLFYLNASYLQYVRGYGLITTGVAIVPLIAPLLLFGRVVPKLVARVGTVPSLAVAFALVGGGLIGLASAAESAPYVVYAVWMVVVGFGLTLALPTLTQAIATSLPPAQAGVGGGLQSTTRELGSALGVAVTGTLLTSRFAAALPAGSGHGRTRTVAQVLATAGVGGRGGVLAAYASGTAGALRIVGIVVLVAGALVTAQSLVSARRSAG